MALTFDFTKDDQAIPYEDNFYHLLDNLKFLYERSERSVEHLRHACQRLEDRNWKDDTLKELAEAVEVACENNRRGFPIDKEEAAAIELWKQQHSHKYHADWHPDINSLFGECWDYCFTPTCIGTIGKVRCRLCAQSEESEYVFRDI